MEDLIGMGVDFSFLFLSLCFVSVKGLKSGKSVSGDYESHHAVYGLCPLAQKRPRCIRDMSEILARGLRPLAFQKSRIDVS